MPSCVPVQSIRDRPTAKFANLRRPVLDPMGASRTFARLRRHVQRARLRAVTVRLPSVSCLRSMLLNRDRCAPGETAWSSERGRHCTRCSARPCRALVRPQALSCTFNSIQVVAIGCYATDCGREDAGASPARRCEANASSDACLAPHTEQCKTCCKLLET